MDLGCGYGRHSLELAKRGYKVVGLDYSGYMINLARKKAKKENLNIKFIKGDMRKINFENHFDYVLSFFTSFGYFTKESERLRVIKEVYRALKKMDTCERRCKKESSPSRWCGMPKGEAYERNNQTHLSRGRRRRKRLEASRRTIR